MKVFQVSLTPECDECVDRDKEFDRLLVHVCHAKSAKGGGARTTRLISSRVEFEVAVLKVSSR